MLAVSRWRTDTEDFIDGVPGFDFTPDDIDLLIETSKGRNDLHPNAIFVCSRFHFLPGVSCCRRQSVFAAKDINFGDNQFFGLEAKW
jgi:hypothetical protein